MALVKCKECKHEISTKADKCPNCGAAVRKTSLVTKLILGLIVFGVVVAMFTPSDPATMTASSTTPNAPKPKSSRDQALADVTLKNFNWTKGGFDTVMLITVTIENKGSRGVKDIELTCRHSSNSGTEIDKNTNVIFETVPPKGRKTIKDFSMGFIHTQATKSSCAITDLKVL